jgi:peptide/nickel transport system substrate-binding protein
MRFARWNVSLLTLAVVMGTACAPAPTVTAPAKPAEASRPVDTSAGAAPAAVPAAIGTPKRGGTLRIVVSAEFTTMDPHASTSANDRQVYQSIFNTLVRLDEHLGIQPELAVSWTTPDPKTYIFTLQRGVKFHDGEPFNAQAVKFNMDRMKTLPKSLRKSEILEIESVDVIDDSTVKFTLNEPSAPLLATLTDRASMMVSPKAALEKGDDFARAPVGTGPFTFVEWVKDDHLTVKKNPNYWEQGTDGSPLPYLDQVIYRAVPDGSVAATAVKTGAADMLDIPLPKDVAALKAQPDLKASSVPGFSFMAMSLNPTKPPFDKKPLREAVGWSLEREVINKAVYFNLGVPVQTAIPPSSWAYDSNWTYWQIDQARARAKLAEAGQPDGFEFSVVLQNNPEFKQLYEVVQEQLRAVGITLKLDAIEAGTASARNIAGDFQAYAVSWSGRPDPDGNVFRYGSSKGENNGSHWATPGLDELLDQSRAISDQTQRKALYSQINQLMAEEAVLIPMVNRPETKVFRSNVEGFVHVPDRMIRTKWMWLNS